MRPKILADREYGECAWPVGSPPRGEDMSRQPFCCDPVECQGADYCVEHARHAYQPKGATQ